MPYFVSLIRLTQRGLDELAKSPDRARLSKERVDALGGRSVCLYATLGAYDFVQVFEMPSAAAMTEYVVTARRDGFVEPLVLPAFEEGEWAAIVRNVVAKA